MNPGSTTFARRCARAALVLAAAMIGEPLGAQPTSSTRPDQKWLQEVVRAERAFSRLSAERGMKPAFLEFLSDSGVVFRPTARNAQEVWKALENPPSMLQWEPAWGEVSHGGDLAVSTGPWILRPPRSEGGLPRHGQFLSLWRRQADGSWKVEADIGISHEQPYRGIGASTFRAGPVHAVPERLREPPDLASLDRSVASRRGIRDGYRRLVTADFQLLRDGFFPYDRVADALAALDSLPGRIRVIPRGSGVSRAADLAYSHGTFEHFASDGTTPVDTTVYFHVWRRDSRKWKISMAVLNPLP